MTARVIILAVCVVGRAQQSEITPAPEASLLQVAQAVLEHHPLIAYQQAQIEVARGLKQQASAAFDASLQYDLTQTRTVTPLTKSTQQQDALSGLYGSAEISEITEETAGASRQFRTGWSASSTLELDRDVDRIAAPRGINRSTAVLQVSLPVLNGRGRAVVTAQETAATMEVDAAKLDLAQQVSQQLFNAASDYWNLVAAKKLLAIAREAEIRAQTDLENTLALVNADQLPRENLNAVRASLAQSVSSRLLAEQTLLDARRQIAVDMGMEAVEIASHPPDPSEDFPVAAGSKALPEDGAALEGYVRVALRRRADYLAAQQRVAEQKSLVAAARNHLLPALNVNVSAGYSGLAEGRQGAELFGAVGSGIRGVNAMAGITYSFAPKNDQARGALLQASAQQLQLEAQCRQLSHAIAQAVASAAQTVALSARQAEKAREAEEYFRVSLDGQREKYHLGSASVMDVLTVEERLTTAMTARVQADLSYAQAVAQFRFATGTIAEAGQPSLSIRQDIFRTLPTLETSAGMEAERHP